MTTVFIACVVVVGTCAVVTWGLKALGRALNDEDRL